MKIVVSSLALAPDVIAREKPSHVVSLLSPEEIHLAPGGHAPERHLRLAMHDLRDEIVFSGEVPPCAEHVAELLAFADTWDAADAILIHCWAGVSRSTAAAFTLACARNPSVPETAIARALREASPTAWPNPVLVGCADTALGRSGRMLEAIADIAEPPHFDAAPFHIPATFAVRVD